MASDQNQFEAAFPEAYDDFEVERLLADLAKLLKKNNLMPASEVALLGKLCGYDPAITAKNIDGYTPGSLRQALSKEVYPAIEKLLAPEEKIEWKTADLPQLLTKYKKSLKGSLSIDIPWQQVCREVLEQQRKQWLTSYPLGSGDRKMPEMYVPLELVEREPEDQPRIPSELKPEKWSVLEQEKRTPISNQEFFEQVFQGKSPKSNGRRIAIIGEPGAGKTTLLQKIGLEVKALPIWIDLADLDPNKHESLQDYLTEIWLTKWALPIIRKLCPEATLYPGIATDELKNVLVNEFEKGNVWLLLDGVDEIAASFRQPLTWIDRQLRGGWIIDAKVVLTCRLNIWSESGNYLADFDVYRNVDFTDEQVEEFIEKWFAKEPYSCEKLKEERNQANDRIKSLIRNPLRLTLLCLTWKKGGEKLPETKAGLYQRLVEGHYNWKKDKEGFALCTEKQKSLNKWLGELAKAALDDKDSRFRLRKNFIESFSTEHQQDDSLRELAIKVGWLVEVGLPTEDEKDADEPVYAFFHPTFQEYFAALNIDDWHYFLNHVPGNTEKLEQDYRIFQAEWQETFLHWMGRFEIRNEQKRALLKALVEFEDECDDFYWYRACLIATLGIPEFIDIDLEFAEQLIQDIVEWSFGYFDDEEQEWIEYLDPLRQNSGKTLITFFKNYKPVIKGEIIKFFNQINKILNKINPPALEIDLYNKVINFLRVLSFYANDDDIFELAIEKLQNSTSSISLAIKSTIQQTENLFLEIDDTLSKQFFIDTMVGFVKTIDNSLYNELSNGISEVIFSDANSKRFNSFDCLKRKKFFLTLNFQNELQNSINILNIEVYNFINNIIKDACVILGKIVKISSQISNIKDNISILIKLFYIYNEIFILVNINIKSLSNKLQCESFDEKSIYIIAFKIGVIFRILEKIAQHKIITFIKEIPLENIETIDRLTWIINNSAEEVIVCLAAASLGKVSPDNDNANFSMVNLILTSKDKSVLSLASDILTGMTNLNQLRYTVKLLNKNFTDEVYENDFERYEACYKVLWHCAQNMSYPDFYDAWHSQPLTTHPEAPDNIPASNSFIAQNLTLTQKIQSIQSNVASDSTLKDTVQLICIDGSQFSDTNNPAIDIYIEMIEQGCPKQQEEPSTMQQLKKYWRLRLKNPQKRVALLFYNSKADREFSETCLTALSTFGGAIAIITDQPCENVKLISSNDPDLINAVLKWLRRRILED